MKDALVFGKIRNNLLRRHWVRRIVGAPPPHVQKVIPVGGVERLTCEQKPGNPWMMLSAGTRCDVVLAQGSPISVDMTSHRPVQLDVVDACKVTPLMLGPLGVVMSIKEGAVVISPAYELAEAKGIFLRPLLYILPAGSTG